MKLNLFAIAGFSVAVVCFLLSFFILLNARLRLHRLWAFFNIVVGIFGFGTFLVGVSATYEMAFLSWKITLLGVSLIAMFFYHVAYEFCGLNNKRMLNSVYCHGILFALLVVFTNSVYSSLRYAFNEFYYYNAGTGFNLLFPVWLYIVFQAFWELFKYLKVATGLKLTQCRYLFWGMLLGFLGGSTTSFPSWGFNIYPAWHFFICVYILLSTYAIFKYQLMDIRLAITRLGIFIIVYSLVLGIPFGLIFFKKPLLLMFLGDNWFWVPMISLLILATAGPFIYFFLQLKAENTLLQRDKRIQEMLKNAFAGITRIRDQHKLLQIISRLLRKILRIKSFAFYIYDQQSALFVLKTFKDTSKEILEFPDTFNSTNSLIQSLILRNSPLVFADLQYHLEIEQSKDQVLAHTFQIMKDLKASIVIPTMSADNLSGFIILGNRDKHVPFSPNLINILSIVGGQVGLALENTIFIETKERGLNEEFERRRLESLGTLCNSISHQMNNRFHAIMQRSSVPLDIYSEGKYKELSREDLISLVETFGKTTERILAISADGGKITETIQNFSKANIEFSVVNFSDALARSLDLVSLKYPKFEFILKKEFPENVLIWGIEAPIQDILFNALDNSCFAMKNKLATNTGFIPQIVVRGKTNHSIFEFEIEDNGTGIKKENLSKVMDPMFTTKSHKDGTGMGTTVMLQFVQNHDGGIRYESEFGLWTKVIISLPLANDEQKKLTKNV